MHELHAQAARTFVIGRPKRSMQRHELPRATVGCGSRSTACGTPSTDTRTTTRWPSGGSACQVNVPVFTRLNRMP